MPVYVDNDANCAALAEAELVDGGPARHLLMLTLGTGVGGGVVIDGAIFRGATGLGAELGHMVVQADGPRLPRARAPTAAASRPTAAATRWSATPSQRFGRAIKGVRGRRSWRAPGRRGRLRAC